MKNILVVVIAMTISCFSFGQGLYIVKDATSNQPVAGAEIRDSLTNELIAKTNTKGECNLPSGRGIMVVTHPEYQTLRFTTKTVQNNIILIWPSMIKLEEVVISASRFEEKKKDVSVPVHVVSANDLAFRGNSSMAEVIQNTGEVFVQKSQQGGGSPVLRGFETNKILLVVDGIRMNNAIYRGGHLQNIITVDNAILD